MVLGLAGGGSGLEQMQEVEGEASYREQKRINEEVWEAVLNPRMPSTRPRALRPSHDRLGRDSGPSR